MTGLPPLPPRPEPMNLWEAVEAMKIVAPHAAELAGHLDASLMRTVVTEVARDGPEQVLRLAALMHHRPVEELAGELAGAPKGALAPLLAAGFAANPLPDLVNAAFALGIGKARWPDA